MLTFMIIALVTITTGAVIICSAFDNVWELIGKFWTVTVIVLIIWLAAGKFGG